MKSLKSLELTQTQKIVLLICLLAVIVGSCAITYYATDKYDLSPMFFLMSVPAMAYDKLAWKDLLRKKRAYPISVPAAFAIEYVCRAIFTKEALPYALPYIIVAVGIEVILWYAAYRAIKAKQKTEAEERDASTHN